MKFDWREPRSAGPPMLAFPSPTTRSSRTSTSTTTSSAKRPCVVGEKKENIPEHGVKIRLVERAHQKEDNLSPFGRRA